VRSETMNKDAHIRRLQLAFAAGLLCANLAWAQAPADVALVSQLTGEVVYVGQGGKQNKAQAFMRVRKGDRFTIPAGGSLRVVFLQGARQESWKGPGSFRAGATQSDKLSGSRPQVIKLPTNVPQNIARVPDLIQTARLGGVTVRDASRPPPFSRQDQAEVAAAKATYGKMRAAASPDDITPELYLFSVLQDFARYDELRSVAEDMQRRQPGNAEIRELATWARALATKK
jgi:hypothetical protein